MTCINTDKMPAGLRALNTWVVWRYEQRPGQKKLAKVPYNPLSKEKADTTRPETGSAFDLAVATYLGGAFEGIGVILTGTGLVGIDLDACITNEVLAPWSAAIVTRAASYTEVSPSGTGIHILCRGALPAGRRKKGNIEMYDSGRFFTVTGNALEPARDVVACQDAINAIHGEHLGSEGPGGLEPCAEGPGNSLTAQEVVDLCIARIPKFKDLWEGALLDHPSRSEAEQAIMNLLAWATGGDPEKMMEAFRESGHYIEKCERTCPKYTIPNAIASCQGRYYQSAQDAFSIVPITMASSAPSRPSMYDRKPMAASNMGRAALPPRQYIFDGDGALPRNIVGLLAAQGACGKTTLAMQIGVSVASGVNCLPGAFIFTVVGPVLLVLAEDDEDDVARVLHRIRARSVNDLDLSQLAILTRGGDPRLVARDTGGNLNPTKGFEALLSHVEQLQPVLVVIDSLSVTAGDGETSNPDGAFVISLLERLCAAGNKATVLVLSHVSKQSVSSKGQAGKNPSPAHALDQALDPIAVRGASSLVNNARWVMTATIAPESIRKSLGIQQGTSLVAYAVRKTNYSARRELAYLVNEGGALRHFEPPVEKAVDFKSRILSMLGEVGPISRREFVNDNDQLVRGRLAISRDALRRLVEELIQSGEIVERADGRKTIIEVSGSVRACERAEVCEVSSAHMQPAGIEREAKCAAI